MTEEEYLKKRIEEINFNLSRIMISRKYRINQTNALRFYENELERASVMKKENDPSDF